jgi:hypothetical protein
MPFDYRLDPDCRVLVTTGRGTITDGDVFAYQRELGARPDLAACDELIDMSGVAQIALPSAERVRKLADLAVESDVPAAAARLAIVAPDDFAFGLGRMYAAYRETNPRSTKQVGVFRSRADALEWLGLCEEVQDSGAVRLSRRGP